MAITRSKKEEVVSKVQSALERSRLTVLVNYKGLSVEETEALRQLLKEQNIDYSVAKNTLVKLAMGQVATHKETATELLSGPVGLAFGYDDEVAPAQVLARFAKEHPVVEIIGAFTAEGTVLTGEQVQQLAKLPSKEQLRGQVVGLIASPLSGLANVLAGNLRGLVQVLSAASKV